MDGSIACPALPAWVPRRALDVETYHGMAAAGLLRPDDRVELIEGELVWMSPQGVRHIGVLMALNQLIIGQLGGAAHLSVQAPVRLDELTEPEPDLALLRPRADRYLANTPPLVADVLLLIEVAESSIRIDREVKAPLYARVAVPEYWIVDLTRDVTIVHREPTPGGYRAVRDAPAGEMLRPALFPRVGVSLATLLS